LERDNFMSAEAAVKYGLIDTVLASRNEMGSTKED
ncbi:MAG: ATP-dependent Clp protease proteolytic subunit, partial [Gammaproteobacteria bacterium]|nr:ATP-dependent Clp protease proteolytic subunit [Gammaproteobacteria bacterium]